MDRGESRSSWCRPALSDRQPSATLTVRLTGASFTEEVVHRERSRHSLACGPRLRPMSQPSEPTADGLIQRQRQEQGGARW